MVVYDIPVPYTAESKPATEAVRFNGNEPALQCIAATWTCVWLSCVGLLPQRKTRGWRILRFLVLLLLTTAACFVQLRWVGTEPGGQWSTFLQYYVNRRSYILGGHELFGALREKNRCLGVETLLLVVVVERSTKAIVRAASTPFSCCFRSNMETFCCFLARFLWMIIYPDRSLVVTLHNGIHFLLYLLLKYFFEGCAKWEKNMFRPADQHWFLANRVETLFRNLQLSVPEQSVIAVVWFLLTSVLYQCPSCYIVPICAWTVFCWAWSLINELAAVDLPNVTDAAQISFAHDMPWKSTEHVDQAGNLLVFLRPKNMHIKQPVLDAVVRHANFQQLPDYVQAELQAATTYNAPAPQTTAEADIETAQQCMQGLVLTKCGQYSSGQLLAIVDHLHSQLEQGVNYVNNKSIHCHPDSILLKELQEDSIQEHALLLPCTMRTPWVGGCDFTTVDGWGLEWDTKKSAQPGFPLSAFDHHDIVGDNFGVRRPLVDFETGQVVCDEIGEIDTSASRPLDDLSVEKWYQQDIITAHGQTTKA
eukprot:TRINITY_DN65145_c0_g1_i1.p1 TRINITY_DN65145_c0_g1~~TRINITY_DN65145_c0_g1_i1.p1  ORF type:complete len:534 (-),score=21.59 TRINITY_DN65145_c0_g1_i1:237-1838(-)